MTKNPIIYLIVLTFPTLMSFSTPDNGSCRSCRQFDDGASKHREIAKNSAIKAPARNYAVLKKYVATNKLVRLSSGEGYIVSKMTHSYPYVTSKAHQFIEELGVTYKAECEKRGVAYKAFIITSATRTKETVARLTKVNPNAVKESTHLYGTTIDISWVRFGTEQKHSQKNLDVLIDVLMDMRDKEACFVKFERMQACFHITVNEDKVANELIAQDQDMLNQMALR
jgi:hypothetical protein